MGRDTKIEWCDSTANPMIGCDGCELWKPDQGVKICYAGRLVERYGGGSPHFPACFETPETYPDRFEKALRWTDLRGKARTGKPWLDGLPRIIFWCDLGDPFTAELPIDWLDPYMDSLAASSHRHLWLTKRPNRAAQYSRAIGGFPPNFWIGTSVTGPEYAGRLRQLESVHAATLFLSYEPCLGDLEPALYTDWIQWVIVGGMSGQPAQPPPLGRISNTVEACRRNGVPVFVKQLGSTPGLADPKGGDWAEWPEELRVREMPIRADALQSDLFAEGG